MPHPAAPKAVFAAGRLTAMTSSLLDRLPDERLVALVRQGSDDAFGALLNRHRPALYGLARRLTRGTPVDADDVCQEAAVRAHRALRGSLAEVEINAAPWLHTIVRNCAISELRRPSARALTASTEQEFAFQNLTARDGDPAAQIVAREEFSELIGALRALPERQRDAFVGRELEGVGHAAIGERLGTTPSAAKGLIVRARRTLEAELRPAALAA